jgi:hypothetical protein
MGFDFSADTNLVAERPDRFDDGVVEIPAFADFYYLRMLTRLPLP